MDILHLISQMNSSSSYYHYTSEVGKNSILSSRRITESTDGIKISSGKGVYLTTLDPSNSMEAIAKNNYYDRWEDQIREGKLEYVFRFIFDDNRAEKCTDGDTYNRDVYIHKGDILLDEVTYSCINTETGSSCSSSVNLGTSSDGGLGSSRGSYETGNIDNTEFLFQKQRYIASFLLYTFIKGLATPPVRPKN